MPPRTLTLGWAKAPLPDGVGRDLTGFLVRDNPSTGVRDPLYARALWLDDGQTTVAWVTADTLAVTGALARRVRKRLQRECRGSPHILSLMATHTHSAPATIFVANCGLMDREWNRAFEDALVNITAEAAERATRKALMRFSTTEASGYSYNRRPQWRDGTTRTGQYYESEAKPRGPINTTLSVLTAHDATTGAPVAAVIHFACHPVFYRDRLIGADWPGRMLGAVERRMGDGFAAIFVQGACGDVDPVSHHDSVDENARRMGEDLAEKALGCIGDSRSGRWLSPRFDGQACTVNLPWNSPPDERLLAEHLLSPAEWTAAPREKQARHVWASRVSKALARGWWRDGIAMPVQVLSLGELAIVGLGAEIFTETALDLAARRGSEPLLVAGYANDDVGYLPPAGEYPFGGYEIERAYRYYGYPDVFAPQAEARAREAAAAMLARLRECAERVREG